MTFSNYPPPNSIHIISIGHYWQLAHTIVFAIALLASGALDHVPDCCQSEDVLRIVFTFLCNAALIAQLKIRMLTYDMENTLLTRCKRSYTIGCGGIIFFIMIPFVLNCFSETSNDIIIRVYFFTATAAIAIYYIFIFPIKGKCKLNYKTTHFAICLAVLLLIVGPGLVWKISSGLEYDWIPVLIGSAYSVNVLFSMVSLMSIYKNQFELTVKDEGCYNDPIYGKFLEDMSDYLDNLGASTPESEDEASSGDIQKKPIDMECGMCMQKFDAPVTPESKDEKDEIRCSAFDDMSSGEIQTKSMDVDCEGCLQKFEASIESKIPRILINCGHTMCHECIQRLLTDNKHRIISCPFCQKGTTVSKGKAENLPKNFAILQMI